MANTGPAKTAFRCHICGGHLRIVNTRAMLGRYRRRRYRCRDCNTRVSSIEIWDLENRLSGRQCDLFLRTKELMARELDDTTLLAEIKRRLDVASS